MKIIIANFMNKTGVHSIVETLGLKKYCKDIVEFNVTDFFGDFQKVVSNLSETMKFSAGGGAFGSL